MAAAQRGELVFQFTEHRETARRRYGLPIVFFRGPRVGPNVGSPFLNRALLGRADYDAVTSVILARDQQERLKAKVKGKT
jgi:hypothetical protein